MCHHHRPTGIAIEVWTTNAGIHFDNFLVATSLPEAFSFADKTFVPKSKLELASVKAELAKAKAEAKKEKIQNEGVFGLIESTVIDVVDFGRRSAMMYNMSLAIL